MLQISQNPKTNYIQEHSTIMHGKIMMYTREHVLPYLFYIFFEVYLLYRLIRHMGVHTVERMI